MRETSAPGYKLSKARASTKVLITLGMLGLFLGLLSSMGLTLTRTGLHPKSVRAYYLGESEHVETSDSSVPIVASEPRPLAELIEVTHLHLMGGSLMLFLLCHLLSVCELAESTRMSLYVVSFISFLTTFSAPWLIIYVSGALALFFTVSILIFMISLAFLCFLPIREMWL